jgi:hypothetical protein
VAPLGRGETGDRLMGAVMSGPAPDTDGVWPRIPIRDLTERLASDDFEQGLVMGRYNGRGVISRDPFAGGELERGEAEAYERMAHHHGYALAADLSYVAAHGASRTC